MTIGHGCKDHGPAETGECCKALSCCGLATSSAPAEEARERKGELVVVSNQTVRTLQLAFEKYDAEPYHYHCGEVVDAARELLWEVTT